MIKRNALRIFVIIFSTLISLQAFSQSVSLNFREADIRAVIESAAEITGRSFVLDPRVRGNLTIIAPGEIDADMFYEAILSALQVLGFQAVDDGAVTRIVPFSSAFQIPQGIVGGSMQTKVMPLNHVAAEEIQLVLRPMMSQGALITPYQAGNYLVITDTASRIQRIENILREIDTPEQSEVDVILLNHISAGEALHIAGQLRQFQEQQLSIVEDSFNNRVIVSGSRTARAGFRTFVKELDVPTTEQGGVEVIYLNYSSAEDIKPILDGMLASETFLRLAGEGAAVAPGGDGATAAASGFTIQADTDNNALVIAASASVISEVRNVIRKLDRRRPQVLIEGVIASVSEDVSRDIASELAAVGRNTGGLVTSFDGVLNTLLGVIADDALSDGAGGIDASAALSGIGAGVTGAFGDFDSDSGEGFGLLIRALATDSRTNILSTPSVLTLDNEEASLSVGQEVPFITGSFTGAADNATNPFQTIEREEVGVVLTVTPQINDGDSVRLQIAQEISSVAETAVQGVSDVVTDVTTLTTNVIIEDRELLVLGGLIQDQKNETKSKVPILGSIPVLGWLFRDSGKSVSQDVLMVFIRPTILREPEDAAVITDERYKYLREYQFDSELERGRSTSDDIFELFDPEPESYQE